MLHCRVGGGKSNYGWHIFTISWHKFEYLMLHCRAIGSFGGFAGLWAAAKVTTDGTFSPSGCTN